jgi:tRNA A37 threonylcarbamoyladenosine modification protein TsaB
LHKLFVLSIASPMQIGVYENDVLVKTVTLGGQASTQLPPVLDSLLKQYEIESIIYVHSPGSFMSLKIAYVTLKTIELIQNIPLYAVDGFVCNGNKPIKAIGKIYFVKEDGTITTKKYQDAVKQEFFLPHRIDGMAVSAQTAPKYEISAV